MPKEIEPQPEEIIEGQPKVGFLDKLKIHKFKILGGVLGVFVFIGAVFGAYKLGYRTGQLTRPREKALKIDCQADTDCVLVINTKDCCSCPTPVNKSELSRNKDLRIYLPEEIGEDHEVRPECKDIICSPCAFWNKAVCESGICKGVFESPTTNWSIYTNKEYNYLIKYPEKWQHTEGDRIVEFESKTSPVQITISIKDNPSNLSLNDWLTQQEENENWKLKSEEFWVGNVKGIEWSTEPIKIETGEKYNQVNVYLAKDSLVYYLRYFIPQSAESQLETFNLMLSTFKFLPSTDSTGSPQAGSGQGE